MKKTKTTTTTTRKRAPRPNPRDALKFRGVSLRLDEDEERRLDLLALTLGIPEGVKVSGRRGKAARRALLAGLEALESEAKKAAP